MKLTNNKIYLALIFASLGHFLVDFMIGILPVYKTMQGLDIAKVGLIAGLCAFIGEGVQIYFGPLGDKGYRKLLLMLGLAGSVGACCFSYTTDYTLIFLMYLMTCIGSGAFHPSAVGIISNLTATKKSLFIGIFAAAGAFGIATSQLIFANTFVWLGGHTLVLGIPAFILIFFVWRKLQEAPSKAPVSTENRLTLFRNFFKRKDLRNLYFATVCNQSLAWGLIFLLPDALKSMGYDSWIYLGGGHLFFVIGGAFAMAPAGYLADLYSPRVVMLTSIAVGATALYIFLFSPMLPVFALCSVLFVAGAAIGLNNPVAVSFGNRLMPEHPGVVNACLMGLVWCISEGIGQTGGGLLTTLFEDNAPVKALMILGFVCVPQFAAAFALPDKAEETKPQIETA